MTDTTQEELPKCELCGEPMPPGETMFKYHGYSGPCPKPPLPQEELPPQDNRTALEALTDSSSLLLAASSQCIATLKAENESLQKDLKWANAQLEARGPEPVLLMCPNCNARVVFQPDDTAAQSQAAAMAGLLEEACRSLLYVNEKYPDELVDRIDAALSAWKAGE